MHGHRRARSRSRNTDDHSDTREHQGVGAAGLVAIARGHAATEEARVAALRLGLPRVMERTGEEARRVAAAAAESGGGRGACFHAAAFGLLRDLHEIFHALASTD